MFIILTVVKKNSLINFDFEKPKSKKLGDMRKGAYKGKFGFYDFILNFLDEHETGTLNEIFKEFVNSGSTYSKVAIQKILKKMEGKKIIKNIEAKGKHPRYAIIDTTEFKIKSDAYTFKDQICANSLTLWAEPNDLDMMKPYPYDIKKKTICDLIFQFGLISLYTCLASYQRSVSPRYGVEKNKKLQELWLRNAMSFENNLPMAKFSRSFDNKLRKCLEKEKTDTNIVFNNEDEPDYNFKKITQQEMKNGSKDLEKIFSEMFPDWYDGFQDSEHVIDKMVNKRLRKVCIEHPEYLLS